jgi:hypothetical protein
MVRVEDKCWIYVRLGVSLITLPASPHCKSDTDCTSLNPTKARRDEVSIFQFYLLFAPSSRNLYTHHPLYWRTAGNNNALIRGVLK